MACILKLPTRTSKGVLTFTTQERDRIILPGDQIQSQLQAMRKNWIFGLHHNWHDYSLSYNPIFDFHMAGEDDLKEVSGRKIPLIPMDACNFSPKCFSPLKQQKHWDILYIANPVFFKKIPEFFQIIRKLYDQGSMYRVLLISPLPKKFTDKTHQFYNIKETYESTFVANERQLFNLITPDYDTPNSFDLDTLAFFYRSSRIFVHTADVERRCRVAAYAWATGIPVVGMAAVASVLPPALRKPPYVYQPESYPEFPEKIQAALADLKKGKKPLKDAARQVVSTEATRLKLIAYLNRFLGQPNKASSFLLKNLDIRLGRHHGFSTAKNRVDMSIKSLLNVLQDVHSFNLKFTPDLDPEEEVAKLGSAPSTESKGFLKSLMRRN